MVWYLWNTFRRWKLPCGPEVRAGHFPGVPKAMFHVVLVLAPSEREPQLSELRDGRTRRGLHRALSLPRRAPVKASWADFGLNIVDGPSISFLLPQASEQAGLG